MQYRATCPSCGTRFTRSAYLRPPHQCPSCRAAIRPEPTWDARGNAVAGIIGIPIIMLGAYLTVTHGVAGLLVGVAIFAGWLFLGWVFYPYFTPFELVVTHTPVPNAPAPPVVIPPVPRYHLKTVVGLGLCILGAVIWAGFFKELLHPPTTRPTPTYPAPAATTPASAPS